MGDKIDLEEIAGGVCGENLTWVLDSNGTLTVQGTGEMDDYGDESVCQSWDGYHDSINNVIIEYGVTNIGEFAFTNSFDDDGHTVDKFLHKYYIILSFMVQLHTYYFLFTKK